MPTDRATDPTCERATDPTCERAPGPVEVRVLGPVEIVGLAKPFSRAAARDLVVYLAVHPAGVRNDAWAVALWPERTMAPSTLHSVASDARCALGAGPDGAELLPRAHGSLRLAPGVVTDWGRFVGLAGSTYPEDWEVALRLVRGRPFEGLGHPDWAVLEGAEAEAQDRIVGVATRLASDRLQKGDGAAAARAARAGLRASPYDERLYRCLLQAADQQGHPHGVEVVMGELLALLEGTGGRRRPPRVDGANAAQATQLVHPQTAELYMALSRRAAATGRAFARL